MNIGIDLVESSRFKEIIKNEQKVKRFLSLKELDVFSKINNENKRIEYIASRFCAKEAIIKAISFKNFKFNYIDLSILNYDNGAPYVEFSFAVDFKINISISHTNSNCVCVALVEENK